MEISLKLSDLGKFLRDNAGTIATLGGLALTAYSTYQQIQITKEQARKELEYQKQLAEKQLQSQTNPKVILIILLLTFLVFVAVLIVSRRWKTMDLVSIEEIIPASIEFRLGDLGKWITKNANKIALVGGVALGGYALYKYGQARGREYAQQQTQTIQPVPTEQTTTQTGSIQPASTTQLPFAFNWITIAIGLALLIALGVAIWMSFKPKK